MVLEKIKEHAGKISAILVALLALISGGLYAKNVGMKSAEESENPAENLSEQVGLENAKNLEQSLLENRQAKADAIKSNPEEMAVTTQVEVIKTIPGATRKVPVTTYVNSTSTSSKSSSSSSTSTKSSSTSTKKTKTS